MRKKRTWAIILSICLLFIGIPVIGAEVSEGDIGEVTPSVPSDIELSLSAQMDGNDVEEVESGEEVTIIVNMDKFRSTIRNDDTKLLTTIQFFIPYDGDLFEYVDGSMQNGCIYAVNALTGKFVDVNVCDNMVKVAAVYKDVSAGAIEESDSTQKLLEFRLRVKDTVSETEYTFFDFTDVYLKNLYIEEEYHYMIAMPMLMVKPAAEDSGDNSEVSSTETENPSTEQPGEGDNTEESSTERPGEGGNTEPSTENPGGESDTEAPSTERPGEGDTENSSTERPGEGGNTEPSTENPGGESDTEVPSTENPGGAGDTEAPSTEKPGAEGKTETPSTENQGGEGTTSTQIKVSKPTGVKAVATAYNEIKISWDKVSGVAGYEVYLYDTAKKQYVRVKIVRTNSLVQTKLKTGTKYRYRVCAYATQNGQTIYGPFSDIVSAKPMLGTTTVKVEKNKAGTVTLSWKKTKGASGYIVYRATSKNGKYRVVKTVRKRGYVNKGLSKGRKYYYKVVPYRTVNGKRVKGLSSAVKSVRVH